MNEFLSGRCRGVTSLVGVLLMVVVALVVAATLTVLALSFGGALSGGAPVAEIEFQYDNFGDGVVFNDLNKPCRFKPGDCNLTKSFSDPPGDSNGADPGVKLEWEETVNAGQRLTIQERNHETAYDVMDAGESITVVYRGEDFTAIVAEDTVTAEHAN